MSESRGGSTPSLSNYQELLTFLDTLSYGDRSTPGLRAAKLDWDRNLPSFYRHRELGISHDEEND